MPVRHGTSRDAECYDLRRLPTCCAPLSDERALPDLLFELYELPGAKPSHRKSVTGAALARAAMAYEKQTVECLHAMGAAGYAYAVVGGVKSPEFYARTVGAIEIPVLPRGSTAIG